MLCAEPTVSSLSQISVTHQLWALRLQQQSWVSLGWAQGTGETGISLSSQGLFIQNKWLLLKHFQSYLHTHFSITTYNSTYVPPSQEGNSSGVCLKTFCNLKMKSQGCQQPSQPDNTSLHWALQRGIAQHESLQTENTEGICHCYGLFSSYAVPLFGRVVYLKRPSQYWKGWF